MKKLGLLIAVCVGLAGCPGGLGTLSGAVVTLNNNGNYDIDKIYLVEAGVQLQSNLLNDTTLYPGESFIINLPTSAIAGVDEGTSITIHVEQRGAKVGRLTAGCLHIGDVWDWNFVHGTAGACLD